MNTLPFLLLAVFVSALISSLVILLVGKMKLGLEGTGLGSALIAGVMISVVAGLATVLFGLLGMPDSSGFWGGMIHFLVTVVALVISGRLLPGIKVTALGGVLLAAAVIGLIYWLGGLALGRLI
jgi:uncharacterized membrane protein YvlD (DUF360 family)